MIFTLCLDVKIVPWEWTARRTSRRAIVAHIGVALRLPIPIVFIVCLALTAFICSLAHEGRTMPLANSSVAVVVSQRWGNRGERSRGSRPWRACHRFDSILALLAQETTRNPWKERKQHGVKTLVLSLQCP